MLSADQNTGKQATPVVSTSKYASKSGTSSLPPAKTASNATNYISSSSGANANGNSSNRSSSGSTPATLKIKREDLSPVSRFREEQKGTLLHINTPDSAYKSALSSSSFQNPSSSRQETPANMFSPALSAYSNRSARTSYSKTQYSSSINNPNNSSNNYSSNANGYRAKQPEPAAFPAPSSHNAASIGKIYSNPSSKFETSFTTYERTIKPTTSASTSARQQHHYHAPSSTAKYRTVEYSDDDDDKIC